MKENGMFRAEYETKLSRVYLHLIVDKEYKEDYQMRMFYENQIAGVLNVEGCSEDGKARYTYEVGGFTPMSRMFEKAAIKKDTILEVTAGLLETIETIQEYMLSPDCLLLEPEYIFFRAGKWYFCYLPSIETDLEKSFHQLTEYFVKTLDYEDTEGIFLAYELHKATLQEHYDLGLIVEEYKRHEQERRREEVNEEEKQRFGNVFCMTDEDEPERNEPKLRQADVIREESGWRGAWRTASQKIRSKRWGIWDDLILESDELPENGRKHI